MAAFGSADGGSSDEESGSASNRFDPSIYSPAVGIWLLQLLTPDS
jgi:hypothetical protein